MWVPRFNFDPVKGSSCFIFGPYFLLLVASQSYLSSVKGKKKSSLVYFIFVAIGSLYHCFESTYHDPKSHRALIQTRKQILLLSHNLWNFKFIIEQLYFLQDVVKKILLFNYVTFLSYFLSLPWITLILS